jgi:hypothetical protein
VALDEEDLLSVHVADKFYEGSTQGKRISFGWNFSCFAVHLIEQDLF